MARPPHNIQKEVRRRKAPRKKKRQTRAPLISHCFLQFRALSSMSDESESEEWWFEVRPKRVIGNSRLTDRRALLCELELPTDRLRRGHMRREHFTQSESTVRLYEVFATHVASSQPICRKSRRSGVDLRELHRCPRSECRSKGRRRFAGNSRDASDAGGSLVGRKHEARPQANDRRMANDRPAPGRPCHSRPK